MTTHLHFENQEKERKKIKTFPYTHIGYFIN